MKSLKTILRMFKAFKFSFFGIKEFFKRLLLTVFILLIPLVVYISPIIMAIETSSYSWLLLLIAMWIPALGISKGFYYLLVNVFKIN